MMERLTTNTNRGFFRSLSAFIVIVVICFGWLPPQAVSSSVSHCTQEGCLLDIADRGWDPYRPNKDVGWCGEACIQMAALYYGAYFPQTTINRAGKPAHPDLYSNDIPVALDALSLESDKWQNQSGGSNLGRFLRWLKTQIRKGYPILVGVKVYPDRHPDWSLDHFVLAVGFTSTNLIYNSNKYGQQERSFVLLSSENRGYSFANRYDWYFGYAITGLQGLDASFPIHLSVKTEDRDSVQLQILIESLEPGREYALLQFDDVEHLGPSGPEPETAVHVEVFTASDSSYIVVQEILRNSIALYQCLPLLMDSKIPGT